MKLILCFLALPISACVTTSWAVRPEGKVYASRGISDLRTPQEVAAWAQENIDEKTRAKWDKTVSDDVILVEIADPEKPGKRSILGR